TDHIVLMSGGAIAWSGTPAELSSNPDVLSLAGMVLPERLRTVAELRRIGLALPEGWVSAEAVAEALAGTDVPLPTVQALPANPGPASAPITTLRHDLAEQYDPRALWLAYMLLTPGILLQSTWTGWLCGA